MARTDYMDSVRYAAWAYPRIPYRKVETPDFETDSCISAWLNGQIDDWYLRETKRALEWVEQNLGGNTMEKFKKDQIHSGYLVELRNGSRRIVTKVGSQSAYILLNPLTGSWNYLSHWGDDGKVRETYNPGAHEAVVAAGFHDIVKVYGKVSGTANYSRAFDLINTDERPLFWERPEPKKLTVDEISALLGYEVEIVGSK